MTGPNAPLEQISATPRIYLADGFASADEITAVLARYGAGDAAPRLDWSRSIAGVSAELPLGADQLLARLAARIEAVLGFSGALRDPTFRLRRYGPGDFHPAHVDCYEIAGHHLVATALIYLTDPLEGGETVFPDAEGGPAIIAARAGRLALWFNNTPDGAVDGRSRHRSELLTRGEKATLAYFVYAPLACAAIQPAAVAPRARTLELECA